MAIIKRGKYYWPDIRIKGKRIRRSLHTDTYELALDKAKELKDSLTHEYDKDSVKCSDFCKQYMDCAWNEKPASALSEEQRLEKIKDIFKDLEITFLSDVTPYHIEQLKAKLKYVEITKTRKMSKATINRYLAILKKMFNLAILWQLYNKTNPVKQVRYYKEAPKREALTPKQVEKILEASRQISLKPQSPLQKAFHDMVALALNTSLRKAEILNLKWTQIKGEEAEISGKGEKTRTVPLNEAALKIFKKQPKKDKYVFDIPNRHQHDLLR